MYIEFPSVIRPATSGTVVRVIATFRVINTMYLALVRVLAECFLELCMENMCKVCTFASPFFWMGRTCTPILLDRSTVLVKTAVVKCIIALVWPTVLLAEHSVFLGPAHLLGFIVDVGVH